MRSIFALSLFALFATSTVTASGVHPAYAIDREVLSKYQSTIVTEMCRNGAEWLRCFRLDPLNCTSITGAIVEGCVKERVLNQTRPVTSLAEVEQVSDQITTCIRSTFDTKYGASRMQTDECKGEL